MGPKTYGKKSESTPKAFPTSSSMGSFFTSAQNLPQVSINDTENLTPRLQNSRTIISDAEKSYISSKKRSCSEDQNKIVRVKTNTGSLQTSSMMAAQK